MKNKFKKILSLSLFSSMLISPITLIGNNFSNKNFISDEESSINRIEGINNNFDDIISTEIDALNSAYIKSIANLYQTKYFTEKFNLDLQLAFKLKSLDWYSSIDAKSDITLHSNLSFNNDNTNSVFLKKLDNNSIKYTSTGVKFWEGGEGGVKKDPNLRLEFTPTVEHSESNLITNQLGLVKEIESIYSSTFSTHGSVKYFNGDEIAYSSSAFKDNYLEAQPNGLLYNASNKFFDDNKIKEKVVNRTVDVFSKNDSSNIFNFVFDNNYIPKLENTNTVLNKTTLNDKSKVIKFSNDFKTLKLIDDLSDSINKLKENRIKLEESNIDYSFQFKETDKVIKKIKDFNFNNLSDTINNINNLNKEIELLIVNNGSTNNVNTLIGILNQNESFNKEMSTLINNLFEHKIIFDKDIVLNNLSNIASLYQRIVGWLSVNNISLNINGKDLLVFENGSINDLSETLDIFTSGLPSIQKKFMVSDIKINRIQKFDKNIFSDSFAINNSIGDSEFSNILENFITDENYKIAYSKDFQNQIIDESKEKLNRSIPIEHLTENLSSYLVKDELTNNVEFNDNNDPNIWKKLEEEIKNKISKLFGVQIFLNTSLIEENDYYSKLEFNNDLLLEFLGLNIIKNEDGTINDNFAKNVEKQLTNQNGNDNDGIFYTLTTIENWNGERTDIGNNDTGSGDSYIGHFKEAEQLSLIKSINKNDNLNIIEIEPKDKNDTTGYFILKLRTMKNSYINNADKYDWLMNNFSNVFIPEREAEYKNGVLGKSKINKVVGYDINWTYINSVIPMRNIDIEKDEFLSNIENIASNSSDGIFNFSNIIFNENNIEYQNEIDSKLILINKEVEKNKKIYLTPEIINSPNELNIILISMSLFAITIISILFFVKIRNDRKIDRKLDSKGTKRK